MIIEYFWYDVQANGRWFLDWIDNTNYNTELIFKNEQNTLFSNYKSLNLRMKIKTFNQMILIIALILYFRLVNCIYCL